jgi:predicted DNA-binding antitoxin AbrB/MazE fold protein
MRLVDACYEGGLLKLSRPLALRPGERVGLIVVRRPDPKRWDLDRLASSAGKDELALAQQGLGEWAQALDEENHR